jgi:hypothetical protein
MKTNKHPKPAPGQPPHFFAAAVEVVRCMLNDEDGRPLHFFSFDLSIPALSCR